MTTNEHPTRCANCRRAILAGAGTKVGRITDEQGRVSPAFVCSDCKPAFTP